jgi:BlaI family transcriptional regulator, penicillinase repressor
MTGNPEPQLSRRQRQIMDIVYTRGQSSVAEVHQAMPDRPTYSTVRALMRILEEKGHLRHKAEGNRYVYLPTRSRQNASRSAARRLLETFFDNSAAHAVAALLEASDKRPSEQELRNIQEVIDRVRKEGR